MKKGPVCQLASFGKRGAERNILTFITGIRKILFTEWGKPDIIN